ncbi:hypothetical protein [Celerinatantimonas yamalensis]|uniref:Uncharacterized protein n=1 Tax=Celerinatantimonas yamalensis TaxID=559956 RepID=A0ABW9G7G5_9GAMM
MISSQSTLRKFIMLGVMLTLLGLGWDWLACRAQLAQISAAQRQLQHSLWQRSSMHRSGQIKLASDWLSHLPFTLRAYQIHGHQLSLIGDGQFGPLIQWLNRASMLGITQRLKQLKLASETADGQMLRIELILNWSPHS